MKAYRENIEARQCQRVRIISELDRDLVDRIDQWGVSAGMLNRVSAIRELLDRGLSAMEAENAST